MNHDWQRLAAVVLLAALGAGIIWWLIKAGGDGQIDLSDGGTIAAAFLSLREIFSKIEKITLGIRTPDPPTDPVGD